MIRHALCLLLILVVPLRVTAEPRGKRTLGIDVNNTPGGDYTPVFEEARRAGLELIVISLDWNELEPAPGTPNEASWNLLSIANAWYPPRQVPVHFMIRPVHTNQDARPEELRPLRFDDPRVVKEFEKLLDKVFAAVPALDVPSLSIGSEVDMWLGKDAVRWREYRSFVRQVAAHAKRLRPGLRIASEVTLAGMRAAPGEVKELARAGDVLGLSHYPVDAEFAAEEPGSIRSIFKEVRDFAASRPVYFYQLGYPSSPECKSSEARQAEFIRELFAAWDEHPTAIPMIRLTWMDDLEPTKVESYTRYYQFDGAGFREFLRTLGLRDAAGHPKEAWRVLSEEARRRGFGARSP